MGMVIEANSSFELSKCSKRIHNALDDMNLLPDEILVSILSCLTLKEAARTSVLSSRWRFLWTYFKGKMDFVLEDWQIQRDQFVTTLNKILKLHRGTGVERFRIIFDEIHYSVEDFNNWVEFACEKSVQRFQLMLGSDNSRFHKSTCIIKPPSLNGFCFKSLQALILRFIEVNDEAVKYFLTNCPNLLRIDLCYSTCLSNILIPSSSHRLKNLCVVGCTNLRKIKIFTRSLEEFIYFGPNISFEVKSDLHLLRTVYYGDVCRGSLFESISRLGRSLPLFQLEHLTLNFLDIDNYFLSDKDHFTLSNLKTLELSIDTCTVNQMLNCLHLVEVAPILHTFTVHFVWDNHRKGVDVFEKRRMRSHQCLKVVKIVNFVGISGVDVQFVKTLIDSVESLEKLIVVALKTCAPHPATDEMEKSRDWRNIIGELFENGSLAATELVTEEVEPC